MGLDARLRYTRMVIKNSFVALLKEKPINKITVKELCDRAEINRATFYKHYLDIYDLLDKLEAQFLEELRESLLPIGEKHPAETLSLIMITLKAEADTYKALFSDHGDPLFPKRVFEVCYELDPMPDGTETAGRLSPVQRRWFYNFIAYGCNGLLCQWISEGMEEPISEVASFAEELIQSAMRSLSTQAGTI